MFLLFTWTMLISSGHLSANGLCASVIPTAVARELKFGVVKFITVILCETHGKPGSSLPVLFLPVIPSLRRKLQQNATECETRWNCFWGEKHKPSSQANPGSFPSSDAELFPDHWPSTTYLCIRRADASFEEDTVGLHVPNAQELLLSLTLALFQ